MTHETHLDLYINGVYIHIKIYLVVYPLFLVPKKKDNEWVFPTVLAKVIILILFQLDSFPWLPFRNTVQLKKIMQEAMAKTLVCSGACHMPMHPYHIYI